LTRSLPATDAATFVQSQLRQLPASGYVIEATVAAPAEQVRGRIGRWATIEPIDPTSCSVHLTTDSFEWPAMALGSLGSPFTVQSPTAFIDYVREWGNRFVAAGGSAELQP
jgi:hypothetical protein